MQNWQKMGKICQKCTPKKQGCFCGPVRQNRLFSGCAENFRAEIFWRFFTFSKICKKRTNSKQLRKKPTKKVRKISRKIEGAWVSSMARLGGSGAGRFLRRKKCKHTFFQICQNAVQARCKHILQVVKKNVHRKIFRKNFRKIFRKSAHFREIRPPEKGGCFSGPATWNRLFFRARGKFPCRTFLSIFDILWNLRILQKHKTAA